MSVLAFRGKTLLKARECRVHLLSEGTEGHCGAAVHDDDLIAAGTLRCHLPPGGGAAELPRFTVKGSGHFSFQCTASAVFTVEAGRLVFEHPPGSGMACALSAAEGASPIEKLASQLQERGCRVRWLANEGATWAARGVESTGSVIASAIKVVGSTVGSGVRAAGAAAVTSGLLEPGRVELHQDAIGAASGAREITRKVAGATGWAIDSVISTVGAAAATVSTGTPGPTEQWMVDTKVVGASSLRAGGQVWQAFQDASADFWREVADTSSDVITHKYGSEAGKTARDSMHAVGNVLEVKAAISKKLVGTIAGKSSGGVADALDGDNHQVSPDPTSPPDAPPSSNSELARCVVRCALSRAATA